MLTRVEIENFKAIEKLSMEFTSQLTVIVGPNGSGKTSVLQAIDSYGLDSIPDKFRRKGSQDTSKIVLHTSYGQEFKVGSEAVASEVRRPLRRITTRESSKVNSAATTSPPPFGCVMLRFAFSGMGLPSSDEGNPPPLESDGSNLASVLSSLCLNQPERFETVKSCLREIIPGIRRIRFQRVMLPTRDRTQTKNEADAGNDSLIAEQLLFDTLQADAVPADSVSEGTLLALGIVTAMVLGDGQCTILIDDLDASLHPAAQADLIRVIRNLERDRPDLQVIATSHSPYLLNSLEFSEIRLTTLNERGEVVCGRLTDHPHFERWKEEMTPGEMWGMWGEAWLTKAPQEVLQL